MQLSRFIIDRVRLLVMEDDYPFLRLGKWAIQVRDPPLKAMGGLRKAAVEPSDSPAPVTMVQRKVVMALWRANAAMEVVLLALGVLQLVLALVHRPMSVVMVFAGANVLMSVRLPRHQPVLALLKT